MRSTVFIALAAGLATPAIAQAPDGQPFRIFFDWGKPELTRDGEATLDEVAAAYQRLKPSRVALAGHADRSGPASVNLVASRRRAEQARAYLVAHGVPAAAMTIAAFGESRPIVPTADGVREMQNRRVEIAFAGTVASASAPSAVGAHSVMIIRADGSRAGAVSLTETGDKAWLAIDASGLPPGIHGMHVHAVGRCEGPEFTSAGPHWNPSERKHGLENPDGHHAGDVPNATIGPDGRLFTVVEIPRGGLDQDGFALVIHAGPDDNRTDPSGNSGARIACAAFTR